MLNRGQIAGAVDFVVQPVKVEKWDGDVGIRAFTGVGRELWSEHCQARTRADGTFTAKDSTAFMLALCVCDELGTLAYDAAKAEDLAEIGGKDADALAIVFDACATLNGLGVKAVDVEVKN